MFWPFYVGLMEMAVPFYCWLLAMSRVKHTAELASFVLFKSCIIDAVDCRYFEGAYAN